MRTLFNHIKGIAIAVAMLGLPVVATAQAPDLFEDFSAFTGISGAAGATAPNDAGTMFELLTASTAGGFTVATGPGQPAPNQAIASPHRTETAFLINSSDFSAVTFNAQSHMIAFRMRYSGTSAVVNSRSTAMMVYEAGANFPCYAVRVGRDSAGLLGLSATVTTGGTPAAPVYGSFTNVAAAEGVWHNVVIMYNNATTVSALDAQIRIWVNPVAAADPPNLQNAAGIIGTQTGPAPLANYGMRANFFTGTAANWPTTVEIDTIGLWNGNGTAGDNDLAAALLFFTNSVPVELSSFGVE